MAAINFPDAPTNGQIFESGGMSWTYVAGIGWTLNSAIVEAGSGFTFIADTMPLPVNVGDTWFDSSTGASGGTSWVAVEEGPAGASEKVWVQFAPGVASPPPAIPVVNAKFGFYAYWGPGGATSGANIPWIPTADNYGNWSVGTVVTVPAGGAGWYMITVNGIYGAAPSANPAYTDIYFNDGRRFSQVHTNGAITMCNGLAPLTPGQTFFVQINPGTQGAVYGNSSFTLACFRVAA